MAGTNAARGPRRAALSVLRAWAKGHDYAASLVDRHASRQRLSPRDRGLLNAIVLGVLRNRRLLDHWIAKFRKGKLDHETRDILRVGLCQILVLELPDHAAVFETVQLGRAPVRGLVNAVLRRAAGHQHKLSEELAELPSAVRFSHPDWLFKRWKSNFGKKPAIGLMEWDNRPAETIARVRRPDECAELAGDSESPGESALPPGFVKIEGAVPSQLIASGAIYIQDPSTRHAVELLAPQSGERILDACAAPGGKAAMVADALGSAAGLVCTDSNESRLPRLRENLDRLGCGEAQIAVHDWTQPAPPEWHGAFDAILADVPCSNTGVLRRRVDVRWRIQPENIEQLVALQRSIVENLLPCLKPGGRLVYSTCSIEPEENEAQAEAILAAHPGLSMAGSRRALPQTDSTDGAFAARFE
jgi:16S rRNA (cytosine967-C5)-methyltransferase